MWSEFVLVFCAAFVFLYLPGTLLLRSVSFRWFESVVFAPAVSLLAYFVLAALLSLVNVSCGWDSLVLPVVFVSICACLLSYFAKREKNSSIEASCGDWTILALGVFISMLAVILVFVKNLDGPSSFVQEYDNTTHMTVLRVFLETEDYSLFNFTKYISGSLTPTGLASASLYPSLWHCFVAIVIDFAGCNIPLAINAVNSFLSAIVFSSSMIMLVKAIFSDKKIFLASAIVAVSCGGFPWLFLIFGPLYPNLAAFCLLPLALASFVMAFSKKPLFPCAVRWIILFIVVSASIGFAQPNALFSAVLFLVPFCVSLIWRSQKTKIKTEERATRPLLLVLFFLAFVILIWMLLYKAPFMQGVVQFVWPALFSKSQAMINAVSLSFTEMNAAQWLLGGIVLCGILYSIVNKKYFWIIAAYLGVLLIYVVNASTDGELKQILTGFWYTDTYRIGAMAAIFSIPVACMGFVFVYAFIKNLCERCLFENTQRVNSFALAGVLSCLFLVANYWPNYTDPGNQEIRTGFGAIGEKVASLNCETVPHMLDPNEADFAKEVSQVVPDNAVVINSPNDGSVFLYALDGINVYYRDLSGDRGSSETEESRQIRNYLDEYANSSDVRDSVGALNAQYVLLLDQGEEDSLRAYLSNYISEEWRGIESITDETPGFEVVLAKDDMRLYRICT